MEEWEESGGHAVTGIGYNVQYDVDGEGPRPAQDWYIVRDNWMWTAQDVAVPVDGHWKATIYAGQPVEPEDDEGYSSENLAEIDFSVDNDNLVVPWGLVV